MSADTAVPTEKQIASASLLRRYVESTAFIAVWMVCGWLFRLSVPAYLVLGVPFVGLFQIMVRRRPLQELWVREPGRSFQLDRLGWVIALALMVMPIYYLFTIALPLRNVPAILFYLCAMAGAVVAGYALRSQRAEALRRALPSFGAALLIGFVLQGIGLVTGRFLVPELSRLPFLFQKFVFYFAASFTLEEVAFRGALDPHICPPGEMGSQARAWGSAFFVSVLWGLWHLPLGEELGVGFWAFLAIALIVEILEGIPLSFSWRQGGTLVMPAIAHALIDAYRDALMP
jgi:hypothetical protein